MAENSSQPRMQAHLKCGFAAPFKKRSGIKHREWIWKGKWQTQHGVRGYCLTGIQV